MIYELKMKSMMKKRPHLFRRGKGANLKKKKKKGNEQIFLEPSKPANIIVCYRRRVILNQKAY